MKKKNIKKRKGWKIYIWEFMMLFLAVFLGSLAEYKLENVVENQHEKQYVLAMIEDVQTDIANIDEAIKKNKERIIHLDSLAVLSNNYEQTNNTDLALYIHYAYALQHPDFVTLTERTVSQLKNAGGMRLIRNRNSANGITLYDAKTKKLTDQQEFYESYQNSAINLGTKLFNLEFYGIGSTSLKRNFPPLSEDKIRLISTNQNLLMEFANTIILFEGMVEYYNEILLNTKKKGTELIETLKTEYKIKN